MKTTSFTFALAFGAYISAVAIHAADISVGGATSSGMTWDNAAWAPQAPVAGDNVTLNFTDADNYILLDSAASIARLTLNNYSYMLLSGSSASLESTANDLILNGNSKLEVKNGATLSMVSGKSFTVGQNASLLVDASTLTGQFYGNAHNVSIQNGSTWNVSSTTINYNGTVVVKDSTVNLTGDYKMTAGTSAGLVLDNSTMGNASTKRGINFGGTADILNGSSIYNINHFNIGRESGSASGDTTVTVRGTSSNTSTINAENAWLNVNNGGTSKLVLDGYSDVTFTLKIDTNKTSGGDFNIAFQNSDNNLKVTGNVMFGSKSDTGYQASSGDWKIYTAAGATNNNFTVTGSTILSTSNLSGNAVNVGIDWAGATNTLSLNNVDVNNATVDSATSLTYLTVRDGATGTVSGALNVGSGAGLSGTARATVGNGSTLTVNNLNLNNSTVSGAVAVSELVVDGGTFEFTSGKNLGIGSNTYSGGTARVIVKNGGSFNNVADIFVGLSNVAGGTGASELIFDNTTFSKTSNSIYLGSGSGYYNSMSGTALMAVQNGSDVSTTVNTRMYQTNNTGSIGTSKLLVDSSTFTTTGEIFFGAHNSLNYTTVGSGNVAIEVTGSNSLLNSVNKTLYHGYNTTIDGGLAQVILSGTNNKMMWSTDSGGSEMATFFMSSSGTAKQTGGAFEVSITGSGNTFESNGITMGAMASTGGSNSVYMKGSSSADKNIMTFVKGSTLEMRASTDAASTIQNTFTMDGNSILTRPGADTVVIQVGSSAAYAGGLAQFTVSGANNEIEGWRLSIGNNGSTGGKAVFRIDGSTHSLSFGSEFRLAGGAGTTEADTIGGRLEFAFDADGISTLNVSSVNEFSGVVFVDFYALTESFAEGAEFKLISANFGWESTFNAWYANSDLHDFRFRDSEDEAQFFYRDNSLWLRYVSTVPEPSTYAAIFGGLALAIAAYRRRK